MNLRFFLSILCGKLLRFFTRLRGGGSAFPGLVAEKICPDLLANLFSTLPMGACVISGTNGKTTTTKIVSELLELSGFKVFTNKTGSNFTRGIISSALPDIHLLGKNKFAGKDIAVLELDEAHAISFIDKVAPRYSLLLNVSRDQLDRFAEIDSTSKLLEKIALATQEKVILFANDNLVVKIADALPPDKAVFFGYEEALAKYFPSDDMLYGRGKAVLKKPRECFAELTKYGDRLASYEIAGRDYEVKLSLGGAHNALNAAGAMTLAAQILLTRATRSEETASAKIACVEGLVKKLPMVRAAFGRGETIAFDDGEIELVLVKNPSGFRAALLDYGDRAMESGKAARAKENEAKIMIAINDDYADGRDVSWLWDVDFSAIDAVSMVSGTRAYDMALRLEYDSIKAENIEEDLRKALKTFLGTAWAGVPSGHNVSLGQRKFDLSLDQKSVQLGQRKRVIFCTYTAMLELRKNIAKVAAVRKWD